MTNTTRIAADMTVEEQEAVQRRVLRTLTLGQMVGSAAMGSAVTVGAFVIQGMLGKETPWGGIATATVTLGTAFTSQVLSRLMRRHGRRPGLQLGYGLAAVGGIIAATGAQQQWLPIFLLGLFVYGNGQASNLLARYTAMDLAQPSNRSRAMSRIVFASTFGAVLGPVFIGPAERIGQDLFGFGKYTGPWLFGAAIFSAAFVNISLQLRPDPLVLAGGIVKDAKTKAPSVRQALRIVGQAPNARLALLVMVISQATMAGVMTMTPVHMKLHGHEGVSQYVISLHVAGMFAFSPIVGRFCDRRGQLPAILLGGSLLLGATTLAALSGHIGFLALFPALWLLGIGWNFGLIGGSSLLTESVSLQDRLTVQGSADLMMSFCGGMAGLSSGFIRRAFGYHVLSSIATLAAGFMVLAAYSTYQSTRRADTSAMVESLSDVAVEAAV